LAILPNALRSQIRTILSSDPTAIVFKLSGINLMAEIPF
jgi:hypothetical protein